MTDAVREYQRAVVITAVLAGISLVVLGVTGHVGVGMLLCVGLGLGIANAAFMHLASLRHARSGSRDHRHFVIAATVRLAVVAAVALAFAVVFWPDGAGVIIGLAAFHVVLFATAVRRRGTTAAAPLGDRPA